MASAAQKGGFEAENWLGEREKKSSVLSWQEEEEEEEKTTKDTDESFIFRSEKAIYIVEF